MQILNISVMNPPSKSITSKPYHTELSESVFYNLNYTSVGIGNIDFLERAAMAVGVKDGHIRDLLVKYKFVESHSLDVSIQGVRLTRDVTYTKYSLGTEIADYSATVLGVKLTREVRYLSTKMDTELCGYSSSISVVKLI